MLRCLCGFYPEFSCTIVGLSEKFDHEGLTRLTSYLVPVYSNSDVDHAAEQIWPWYGMKEALTDPEARNAKTLARRMGLTIQYLPVYEHDGIDSMVFFSDGELTVGYDFTIEENGKKVRFKDPKKD